MNVFAPLGPFNLSVLAITEVSIFVVIVHLGTLLFWPYSCTFFILSKRKSQSLETKNDNIKNWETREKKNIRRWKDVNDNMKLYGRHCRLLIPTQYISFLGVFKSPAKQDHFKFWRRLRNDVRVKNVSCETESISDDDIMCSIKKSIKCCLISMMQIYITDILPCSFSKYLHHCLFIDTNSFFNAWIMLSCQSSCHIQPFDLRKLVRWVIHVI